MGIQKEKITYNRKEKRQIRKNEQQDGKKLKVHVRERIMYPSRNLSTKGHETLVR